MLQVFLALLNTAQERDKFTRIYGEYRDLMFYVARKYLDSDADREIVVDAALHGVLRLLDTIEDPVSAKTKNLMALITRNKCVDLLRRRNGSAEGSWEETAEQAVLPQGQGSELSLAIAAMSEAGRDAILLRYYYGYSAAEIAKLLGISKDAARKRLERAKAELKGLLEEDER